MIMFSYAKYFYLQFLFIGTINCCTMSVDSGTNDMSYDFDLSSLERPYGLTWTDRYTGMTYEATVCNSARLMSPKCSIQNAVAMESDTCKAYGRFDSLLLTDFLDENHPENGIVLSYGNGGNCQSSTTAKESAVFMIACEESQHNQDNMLYKVESSPDGCQHIFYFQGPAGCGTATKKSSGGGTANSTSNSSGGMIFLYCLLGVATYFFLGWIYGRYYEGAEGLDALPHSEYLLKAYDILAELTSYLMNSMSVGSGAGSSARRMGAEFTYSAVNAANPEAIARSAKELGSAAGETVSHGVHSAAQSVSNVAEKYVPQIKAAGGQISKAVAASADKYIPPAIGKHFKKSAAAVNPTARYDVDPLTPGGAATVARPGTDDASNPILKADDDDDEEETVSFGTEV